MRHKKTNREKGYPQNIFDDLGIPDEPDAEMEYYLGILTMPRGGCLTGDRSRILELYYREGCSLEQTAFRLHTTEGHIRRELYRIRHILKKNLLSIYFGPETKFHHAEREREYRKFRRRFRFTDIWDELEIPDWNDIPEIPDRDDVPIEDLELSVRSFNCLKRAGYNTAGSIARAGKGELSRVRNLGKKSLDEITRKLESRGYVLKR